MSKSLTYYTLKLYKDRDKLYMFQYCLGLQHFIEQQQQKKNQDLVCLKMKQSAEMQLHSEGTQPYT